MRDKNMPLPSLSPPTAYLTFYRCLDINILNSSGTNDITYNLQFATRV